MNLYKVNCIWRVVLVIAESREKAIQLVKEKRKDIECEKVSTELITADFKNASVLYDYYVL